MKQLTQFSVNLTFAVAICKDEVSGYFLWMAKKRREHSIIRTTETPAEPKKIPIILPDRARSNDSKINCAKI